MVLFLPGRGSMLSLLHDTHSGISKIKSFARRYVQCGGLELMKHWKRMCIIVHHVLLHLQKWPENGQNYMLTLQDHLWVTTFCFWWMLIPNGQNNCPPKLHHKKPSTSFHAAAGKSHLIISTHSIPEMPFTDKRSVCTSIEFKKFSKRIGIHHITSSQYHSTSNGLVEHAVQTFEQAMVVSKGWFTSRRKTVCRVAFRRVTQVCKDVNMKTRAQCSAVRCDTFPRRNRTIFYFCGARRSASCVRPIRFKHFTCAMHVRQL